MPLYKSSQEISMDNITDLGDKDEIILYEEKPEAEDVIELHKPEEHAENMMVFKLPTLPGCKEEMPLEVSEGDEKEEKSSKEEDKNDNKEMEVLDPWDPHSKNGDVLAWVKDRFDNIPRHSGQETTGIERVISYLKKMNTGISKAISEDYDGKVDIGRLEVARKEIYSAIDRCETALLKLNGNFKKKKSGEEINGLIKEAGATRIGGIIITVPLLIETIARTCINSNVSAGKDLEKTAAELIKKYKLDDREQMELFQLMADMSYPIRRPRGYNTDEKIDPKSVDTYDWMQNTYS